MKTDTTKATSTTTTTSTASATKGKLVKGTKKQHAPMPCLPVFAG